jgi:hypothetical protein
MKDDVMGGQAARIGGLKRVKLLVLYGRKILKRNVTGIVERV